MERVVSQSKELDLGTTMIKHMLHGGCEIILPILQSQMKNKFSFSNILLCEAFELIGLPGLILTTGNAKKIKSATSQGLENFEEIVLHELSSFSHRALSIALDPSYSSSIENLRSAKGVKFIYIRK